MRRRLTVLVGTVAAGAVVVTAATSIAATKPNAASVTCKTRVYFPMPTQLKGIAFSQINCPKPAPGVGVGSITYVETVSSTRTVTYRGVFKQWFASGTTHGTGTLTGKFTTPSTAIGKGSLTITGGTGTEKAVRGRGTILCKPKDGGEIYTCTELLKLAGLSGRYLGMFHSSLAESEPTRAR